jgi:hypothetical protein
MDKKHICVWYEVCPIKEFYEEDAIDGKWVNEYCWGDSSNCARKRLEEKGKYVPDNMMPDGTRDKNLG